MIIDAHVNITHNGKWFNTNYDASLERLCNEMDKARIEKCLLISMPLVTENRYIASIAEKYPKKFRGLGHIDFSGNLLKQVDDILAMGLSGIKIHPRLQNVNICHQELDGLWKYFDQKNINLLIDGYYQTSRTQAPIRNMLPLAYEDHLRHYPNVTFILAHAGCHRVIDNFFLCRSYENFYCDISYSINIFEGTSFDQDYHFLIKNADRKVLFGSDFPEISMLAAKKRYDDLAENVSRNTYNNVGGANAYHVFWESK
jgi:predicted TIM-barrel fold metal-dependent hydrolase